MSKKKEKPLLSDKIAELIAPRRLLDPEIDSDDETAARAIDYDIEEENEPNSTLLSDIRKKNVKLLDDVDEKYRGKVSSRKDFEMDSQDSSSENETEKEEEEEEVSANEESTKNFSMLLTPKQKILIAREAGVDDDLSEDEIETDASDMEDNIKSFSKKLNNSSLAPNVSDDSDEDDLNAENEELEKWDDDYEGEEEVETDETIESGSDNDSDEEESDFDAGDMVPKTSKEPEPSIVSILPKKQTDDHLQKGASVQNQLQIWEKLLEVRIHSQKMLIKANSLPIYEKFHQLKENTEFSELAQDTEQKLFNLTSKMWELQTHLLKKYPETKELALKRKSFQQNDDVEVKKSRLAEQLEADYSNFREYQNSVISKWHDRTKLLTPGSIKTQKQQGNIDVLRKIEGVLANREELVKRSQLLKGGYELFDNKCATVEQKRNHNFEANDENNVEEEDNIQNDVYCSEIYDDADFYHAQLRELIEYKTNSSSSANEMAKQFMELQKLRKKMKKEVDTRASKGRKIRYVVHNKLVSFMAPNNSSSWNEDQKNELFKSLFGAQS